MNITHSKEIFEIEINIGLRLNFVFEATFFKIDERIIGL